MYVYVYMHQQKIKSKTGITTKNVSEHVHLTAMKLCIHYAKWNGFSNGEIVQLMCVGGVQCNHMQVDIFGKVLKFYKDRTNTINVVC